MAEKNKVPTIEEIEKYVEEKQKEEQYTNVTTYYIEDFHKQLVQLEKLGVKIQNWQEQFNRYYEAQQSINRVDATKEMEKAKEAKKAKSGKVAKVITVGLSSLLLAGAIGNIYKANIIGGLKEDKTALVLANEDKDKDKKELEDQLQTLEGQLQLLKDKMESDEKVYDLAKMAYEVEIKRLNGVVADLTQKIKDSTEGKEIKRLSDLLDASLTQIDQLTQKINNQELIIDQKTAENNKLLKDYEAAMKQNKVLEDENNKKDTVIKNLNLKIDSQAKIINEKINIINKQNDEIEKINAQLAESRSPEEYAVLLAQKSEAETKIIAMGAEIQALTESNSTYKAMVGELQIANAEMKITIADLSAELADAQEQLKNASTSEEKARLEQKIKSMEKELAKKDDLISELCATRDEIKADLEKAEKEKTKTEKEKAELKSELEAIQKSIKAVVDENINLKADNEKLLHRVAELQETVVELETAKTILTLARDAAEEQAKLLKDKYDELLDKCDGDEKLIIQLREQITGLLTENAQFAAELATAEEAIYEYIKEGNLKDEEIAKLKSWVAELEEQLAGRLPSDVNDRDSGNEETSGAEQVGDEGDGRGGPEGPGPGPGNGRNSDSGRNP